MADGAIQVGGQEAPSCRCLSAAERAGRLGKNTLMREQRPKPLQRVGARPAWRKKAAREAGRESHRLGQSLGLLSSVVAGSGL